MTTWPLRRTQITVVERIRLRFRECSAVMEFVLKAMEKPLKTEHLAGRLRFKMQ
jgi:hypothetical protein